MVLETETGQDRLAEGLPSVTDDDVSLVSKWADYLFLYFVVLGEAYKSERLRVRGCPRGCHCYVGFSLVASSGRRPLV